MPKHRTHARWTWTALFVLVTMLSLDYWWWDAEIRLGVLGLPIWIFYFVGLQFVLAVAVYFFARHYWDDGAEHADGERENRR